EYIGPNRFQFPFRQKEIANACLMLLPAHYRMPVAEQTDQEIHRTPFKKGLRWFVSRLVDKLRDGELIGVLKRRALAYRAKWSRTAEAKTRITFPTAGVVTATYSSDSLRIEAFFF